MLFAGCCVSRRYQDLLPRLTSPFLEPRPPHVSPCLPHVQGACLGVYNYLGSAHASLTRRICLAATTADCLSPGLFTSWFLDQRWSNKSPWLRHAPHGCICPAPHGHAISRALRGSTEYSSRVSSSCFFALFFPFQIIPGTPIMVFWPTWTADCAQVTKMPPSNACIDFLARFLNWQIGLYWCVCINTCFFLPNFADIHLSHSALPEFRVFHSVIQDW